MHRPLIGLLASSFIAVGAVLAAQQSTPPQTTFKSGVDLILIEATVLDDRLASDHRPVLAVLEWIAACSPAEQH